MSSIDKPQTFAELGLMVGFPPAPDKIVTHEKQLYGPYNRWSFQNELPLNPVVDVWRGSGPPVRFERAAFDMSQVTYRNYLGNQYSFDDMVEMSYTDGILILHQGKAIYERYLNGFQSHSLHAWASCSKSITGVLGAMLVHEKLLDPDALVSAYLPELKDSGFGRATLRQVMNMTTAVGFAEPDSDPVNENLQYSYALGWRAKPYDYNGPANVYEFLPSMQPDGVHGQRFTYLTPNTDILAWVIKRVSGQSLAQVMHERIWSRLGVERDAFWIVDSAAAETAGSGLITTLGDMARFGQMLLQKGRFNDSQILPAAVVEDIEAGGDPEAFSRGPVAGPMNQGWSYRHQWWVTHDPYGTYLGMGYGGQMIYIVPAAQLVIARFSSYPTPTPAGNEFYSAFGALPALVKVLMG